MPGLSGGITPGAYLGGAALQGGINLISGIINNGMAQSLGDYNRKQNYLYNEKSAAAADARTRSLYNDLYSPKALLNQYKEAGLSPSLMFGGGGVGGTSVQGAQGEGASGINQQTYGITPVDMAAINKLNAEANLANERANTEGGENERGKAEIGKLFAEAGAAKAAAAANESQAHLNEGKTRLAYYESIKAYYEGLDAGLTYEFNQNTFDTRKQIEANKCALLIADRINKEKNTELQEQQIKELETRIVQMYEQIHIDWANAMANGTSADAWANYLNEKTNYIEQEFKLEGERLGIQKTSMWLNWSADMFRTTVTGVESAMLLKNQGMQQAPIKGYSTNSTTFDSKGNIKGSKASSTTYHR